MWCEEGSQSQEGVRGQGGTDSGEIVCGGTLHN
jgi:hypothetical protein